MPLLIFLLFLKRNRTIWVKVLLFYVCFCFVNDSVLLPLDSVVYEEAIYNILSAFTIIEYSLFAFFLYSILINKIFKVVILFSTIGFYLFAILYFFTSPDESFDSLSASVESILIIAYCIFYLFDQMNKPQMIFIYQEPNFWFVVGFMVYLSGNLFLFIQANSLHSEIRANFWKINLFANVTKNILFAIAFFIKKDQLTLNYLEHPYDDFAENPSRT